MRDPEMCFEFGLAGGAHLNPFYWRNDYAGVEQWSRFIRETNYCYPHRSFTSEHERFAKLWDNNLREQGFAEAFAAAAAHTRLNRFPPRSGHTAVRPLHHPMRCNRSKGACHHEQDPPLPAPFRVPSTIRLAMLTESATNPRRTFEENALKELAETIRSSRAFSTPSLVRPEQ